MNQQVQLQSVFVSVLSWVFIVFSAFGCLIMLMETLLFFMMPFDQMLAASAQKSGAPQVPALVGGFMRGFILIVLGFNLWALISSIGMLRRKNWARISIIVLLSLGLFWQLIGMIWSVALLVLGHSLTGAPVNDPQAAAFMQPMLYAISGFSLVLGIGMMVLFIWIIRKLVSPAIRAEFVPVSVNSEIDSVA